MVATIVVEVPHRISGFFQIMDHVVPPGPTLDDLASIGSRGGGPCLSACGTTRIVMDGDDVRAGNVRIHIDGKDRTGEARTTGSVLKWFPREAMERHGFTIHHDFPLEPGCGYGSSGCGAVGTAVGMNVLLDLGWSLDECGKIAHCAEVENRTGLGTVAGQIKGGCTISINPGYPFSTSTIIVQPHYKIACATRGGISTSQMLGDPVVRKRIIEAGSRAMEKIIARFTIACFIKTAIQFVTDAWMPLVEVLDLGGVKNLMDELNQHERRDILGASMNQMGRSVYCIYRPGSTIEGIISDACKHNGFPDVRFLDFNPVGPRVSLLENDA